MHLAVDPDHLPVIASQLGVSAEDLLLMLGAAAPVAVPAPPGLDDVSALIPAACAKQAGLFFPATAKGVFVRSEGAVALPEVGVAFAAGDAAGGGQVLSRAAAF
ncbi:PE domain-containing protein [Streptomyces gardneri]|uniref:PE domain-containing protein n=1 Tax=Nocardia sputi TaxID=2943705 RepID=UPI0018960368|nr:PE domain-containing protein [Nocardia sputi]MBF6164678.1 PE domain-containing protein [Streptomyces gardneri]MBF6209062.1 PE domain-containing protein [Streptomyces gardneri]UAK32706.1 PE domain-containing protein [Nocardia asteroides]